MGKYHLEARRVIRAPPEKVWAAFTDVESHPKWDKSLISLKVVKKEENVTWMDIEGMAFGLRRRVKVTHTGFPPNRVEVTSETEGVKLRSTVTLEAIREGTSFRNIGEAEVTGRLMSLLAPIALRRRLKGHARAFAAYVESLP